MSNQDEYSAYVTKGDKCYVFTGATMKEAKSKAARFAGRIFEPPVMTIKPAPSEWDPFYYRLI